MNYFRTLSFSTLVLLSGCATELHPIVTYPGDPLPIASVARLRVHNVNVTVIDVDGHSSVNILSGNTGYSDFHLLPGVHTVQAKYLDAIGYPKYIYANTSLQLAAEAGHVYTLRYSLSSDKKSVTVYAQDHGLSYDAKCAQVNGMPRALILIGHNVPTECQ